MSCFCNLSIFHYPFLAFQMLHAFCLFILSCHDSCYFDYISHISYVAARCATCIASSLSMLNEIYFINHFLHGPIRYKYTVNETFAVNDTFASQCWTHRWTYLSFQNFIVIPSPLLPKFKIFI